MQIKNLQGKRSLRNEHRRKNVRGIRTEGREREKGHEKQEKNRGENVGKIKAGKTKTER